ncbi:hypothetical protein HED60_15020 [Planctomycetales bacterium ZRK34]|nr:hypothetical protein HED60_15020 [Planctomycetales bacterium ZRK34]
MIHPNQTFDLKPLEEQPDAVLTFQCRTVAYWIHFAQRVEAARKQHPKILDYVAAVAALIDEPLVGWSGFEVEYAPGKGVAEVLTMLPVMDVSDELSTAQALSEIARKKSLRQSRSDAESSAATAQPDTADRNCPSSSTALSAATGPGDVEPAAAPDSG